MEFIYHACIRESLNFPEPPVSVEAARSGLKYINELGYIPVDRVSEFGIQTLEFAYDDGCIAQITKALNRRAITNCSWNGQVIIKRVER